MLKSLQKKKKGDLQILKEQYFSQVKICKGYSKFDFDTKGYVQNSHGYVFHRVCSSMTLHI